MEVPYNGLGMVVGSAQIHAPMHTVQQHRFSYNEPMPLESVTQSLCDLALRFGEDSDEGGGGGGLVSHRSHLSHHCSAR